MMNMLIALITALCLIGALIAWVNDNTPLGILLLCSAFIVVVVVVVTNRIATRYLRGAKADAYRLLKAKKPRSKMIEETINDLNRFPRDQEAKELIKRLTEKRIEKED